MKIIIKMLVIVILIVLSFFSGMKYESRNRGPLLSEIDATCAFWMYPKRDITNLSFKQLEQIGIIR